MKNINRVLLTGNLTKDPDLKTLPSGTAVCELRIAVNGSKKDATDHWVDDPGFYTVTVWGAQGENCARYLAKGRPVAIDGHLKWSEWQPAEGAKRERVTVVADSVQFLSDGKSHEARQQSRAMTDEYGEAPSTTTY